MNDDISGDTSSSDAATDWKRVSGLTAGDIRRAVACDPDIAPTDADFWEKAHVVRPTPQERVTLDLDKDLLAWLRGQPGFETRVNAILRDHMHASTQERG